MPAILPCEIGGVLEKSSLAANPDCGVQVKWQIVQSASGFVRSSSFRFDEVVQCGFIASLEVAVKK